MQKPACTLTDAPADHDVSVLEQLHTPLARADMMEAREVFALELGRHRVRVDAEDESARRVGRRLKLVRAVREERDELLARTVGDRVDADVVLEPELGSAIAR